MDDEEISAAHGLLRQHGIDTSAEGAACVAAVKRARTEGRLAAQARVVVLLTGHATQWRGEAAGETSDVDSYLALRTLLRERFGMEAAAE